MAKKRVHEIAKELGFQNRDLIDKLVKLGFEVKSHSSTVDEEDVRRALKKAEDDRRAKTEEKRLSKKVMRRRPKGERKTIIRRRTSEGEAPDADAVEAAREAIEATASDDDSQMVGDGETIEARAETEPTTDAATEVAAEDSAETSPAVQAADVTPATEAVAAAPVDETAQADAEPIAGTADEVEAASSESDDEAKPSELKKEARTARVARPEARKREEPVDEEDEKPEMTLEDLGLSESDFAVDSPDRVTHARVAPPPPSTKPAVLQREEETASKVVRRIDPAVLKARLASAKRPEPPKEWGKQDMPASPMTELVVRTDASGKRRELVDVRKEAARGKAGRAGQKRREEMSAKDLLEHRRGQVYYPSPNRRRMRGKPKAARKIDPALAVAKRPIEIGESITVAELAKQMSMKSGQILIWLMRNGIQVQHLNAPIEHDVAASVALAHEYEVRSQVFDEEAGLAGESMDEKDKSRVDDPDAQPRCPVVTVMGHVDHGKTSLLDRIRKANVADGEAGGITQAIAGYQVSTSKGDITFLDTPGHKAFTAMRARGANVTDIVVLVVAADDGVMPQTQEAIEHAKAAGVPIIVAINKIDKPEANPDRVLQQLAGFGVQVEAWGGDVLSRQISAKTGEGVEDLLEQIALQSEIMELKANPNVPAVGRVIEAEIHKGRGPVATVLVQEGTLAVGAAIIAGESIGRIRAMMDDAGERIATAGPGTPVQILGLDGVPEPGDELRVAKSVDDARSIAAHRRELRRETDLAGKAKVSLQDFLARMQEGQQAELRIIIKADVQGSVEALKSSLLQLATQKVRVNVIHGGVGAVVESDVEFARASDAIIIGFNVRPDTKALKAARALGGVDIRTHKVIYECLDEVHSAMEGLLAPIEREKYLGRAEVRQTFTVPKIGTVAGCAIVDGVVQRNAQIRVLRDSREIYSGKLASLKRFKDDVREVKEGFECGMGVEKFNDLKIGDIIESFEIEKIAAKLDEPVAAQGEARA